MPPTWPTSSRIGPADGFSGDSNKVFLCRNWVCNHCLRIKDSSNKDSRIDFFFQKLPKSVCAVQFWEYVPRQGSHCSRVPLGSVGSLWVPFGLLNVKWRGKIWRFLIDLVRRLSPHSVGQRLSLRARQPLATSSASALVNPATPILPLTTDSRPFLRAKTSSLSLLVMDTASDFAPMAPPLAGVETPRVSALFRAARSVNLQLVDSSHWGFDLTAR